MKVYAGYTLNRDIEQSASGGVASTLTKCITKDGGVVYAVKHSDDYKSAYYEKVDDETNNLVKGSKYFQKRNVVLCNGKEYSVYDKVYESLKKGREVLFIGVGCDIFALNAFLDKWDCSESLYTIELICDGVVPSKIHEEYIDYLERKFLSKVVDLNVRDKRYGWGNSCLHVRFDNQQEFNALFSNTQYGRAFRDYKCKRCYSCKYKGTKNHVGDLIIGDYWGCIPGMNTYNPKGVSLIIENSKKGEMLISKLKKNDFYMEVIDYKYAIYNQPRFMTPHPLNEKLWIRIEDGLRKSKMFETLIGVDKENCPHRFLNKKYEKLVVWGTGKCFVQNIQIVECYKKVAYCIDNNSSKWNTKVYGNLVCEKPDVLKNEEGVFVLIMVQNSDLLAQVVNQLLEMKFTEFDFFDNWLKYRDLNFID